MHARLFLYYSVCVVCYINIITDRRIPNQYLQQLVSYFCFWKLHFTHERVHKKGWGITVSSLRTKKEAPYSRSHVALLSRISYIINDFTDGSEDHGEKRIPFFLLDWIFYLPISNELGKEGTVVMVVLNTWSGSKRFYYSCPLPPNKTDFDRSSIVLPKHNR